MFRSVVSVDFANRRLRLRPGAIRSAPSALMVIRKIYFGGDAQALYTSTYINNFIRCVVSRVSPRVKSVRGGGSNPR